MSPSCLVIPESLVYSKPFSPLQTDLRGAVEEEEAVQLKSTFMDVMTKRLDASRSDFNATTLRAAAAAVFQVS